MAKITLDNLAHSYLPKPASEGDYALKELNQDRAGPRPHPSDRTVILGPAPRTSCHSVPPAGPGEDALHTGS